ncbi:CBS domain-containing protein [Actinacidiphila bryophytorum]|uniref:CBS domain-containing protein n=1 Tax=Actinacidiphila bryophytorum TaxID=1436133 RepID=A0A9W4E575_9ACTN|nr:CBS domain-containing protein [Actinacidiphila bryophytorum]MBM9438415.1 CBS domain-containing protein [Actinacidiphila bryophytorum]MBN6542311.1 CBS domain-containing protein [Actinacidiphila bryophytorum]CAG7613821.1 CBS domain-containing protein [Actinacidiphila bryophytorum]
MRQQPGPEQREFMLRTVAEVMRTDPVTIAAGETVLMAWELLERSGRRHLPVMRPDGRCVGLLDRADLAVACAAPATSLTALRVGDLVLGRRPAVVHAGESVRRAVRRMSSTGAEALPVLGDNGSLVGLLTAPDLIAALAGHAPPEEPAHPWEVPFPVMPGLPPKRRNRTTGVP